MFVIVCNGPPGRRLGEFDRALAPQVRAMRKILASQTNHILSRLRAADMALLEPDLKAVELPLRYVLEERPSLPEMTASGWKSG